ncbi:MAG TPA: hypothetical protein VFB93_00580 [Burkholderiales bacterium]|nr:hypothetical protein [Burkholderiales bacterium]
MGHACTHDQYPGPNGNNEHPVVAVIAIIAIVAAMLLIAWARLELHGTEEIEAALTETPIASDLPLVPKAGAIPDEEREVDAAVTSSRFATGFSP